jgi:hypothetical protein
MFCQLPHSFWLADNSSFARGTLKQRARMPRFVAHSCTLRLTS